MHPIMYADVNHYVRLQREEFCAVHNKQWHFWAHAIIPSGRCRKCDYGNSFEVYTFQDVQP